MTSPRWKVYDSTGTYQASCKELEAAAALVALYGDGATIRDGHSKNILWHEGKEKSKAAESYDFCAVTAVKRVNERHNKWLATIDWSDPA